MQSRPGGLRSRRYPADADDDANACHAPCEAHDESRHFHYKFDATGHTAQTDLASAVRDMIEQILFTSPGERVNRPTFGSGTAQLVFAPNSDVLAAAQQQAIQAGLQQWLSDLIRVQSVTV